MIKCYVLINVQLVQQITIILVTNVFQSVQIKRIWILIIVLVVHKNVKFVLDNQENNVHNVLQDII
jgi:hypothetical protein